MKLNQYLIALSPLLAALSSPSQAQVPVDQIRLGTPSYMGTGCPLGTVSASLSPDAQSLSILFGQFVAESGGMSGRTIDRKQCNISIPVNVPGGFSVSIVKIDYRGYHRLPLNSSATFDVEYFFAGQNGPGYHKSFVGAADGNFTLNNNVIATSNVFSPCGQDVNLRTNTSIAVQSNMMNEQAMITLDSADFTSGVVYRLQWRQCGANPYPTPVNPYPTPYNPYPTPYPTPVNPYPTPYPTPVNPYPPQLGPCVINSYFDQRGFQVFMVKDGTGRILGNTVQYAEALRLAQQSQQMGFCHGIVNNVQNPNPYPNPQPYPTPVPPYPNPGPLPPQQNTCQVKTGRNSYGQTLYRVLDRSGAILITTPNYNQAIQIAQNDPRCFRR